MSNKIKIPLFVVHYTKLHNRKNYLDSEFNKYFENIEYITTYDQEDLNSNILKERYIEDKIMFLEKLKELWDIDNLQYRKMDMSEISCYFKHTEALKRISEGSDDFGIVIEDDVIPILNPVREINKIVKKNKNWDILFIGKGIGTKFIFDKLKVKSFIHGEFKVNHPASNCAEAYIVKKETAKILFDNLNTFHLPYDWELAFQMYKLQLNVYWKSNPVFEQGSKTGKYNSALR